MRSHSIFSVVNLIGALITSAVAVEAATFNFRVTKKQTAWECTDQSKPDPAREGLSINVLIDGAPDPATVVLNATYTGGGEGKTAAVPHSTKNLWQFADKDASLDAESALVVEGTLAAAAVKCTATVAFAAPPDAKGGQLPAPTLFTRRDAEADAWLQSEAGIAAAALLVDRIHSEHDIAREKIVLLRHLPSGATAFPFPSSVSEHQVMQIAIVVNLRELSSVEAAFTACERPQRERIRGDFGTFAAGPQAAPELRPDFALKPIGSLFQCGPESLSYSLTVSAEGRMEKPAPAVARLEVRPVYHLGATALFGFDLTKRPTFGVRSAVVTQTDDRIGGSLYLGATWYPWGVDYGRMRWWNHVVNPFAAVSLENMKENFVVGNAFTVTGGISLAVGAAFHRLDELDGMAAGDPFTGEGTVPTVKRWSKRGRGLFIGAAVDTNVFSALKKMGAPAAGAAGK